jgi:hypothetical protein
LVKIYPAVPRRVLIALKIQLTALDMPTRALEVKWTAPETVLPALDMLPIEVEMEWQRRRC